MVITRSIPACAGEPARGGKGQAGNEVYPRVCGGTFSLHHARQCSLGLSPRVRGNPDRSRLARPKARSIPACAGEPVRKMYEKSWSGVYPRVCGGTSLSNSRATRTRGLSPRVRGNPIVDSSVFDSYRSIPACAGEPLSFADQALCDPVYPRVCGGTPFFRQGVATATGLSPRVRGNQQHGPRALLRRRSIPACAGEPADDSGNRRGQRVYPRVCGGT